MLRRFVAVCVAVSLAGCAAKKHHLTADQYFNEATESFRTGSLTLAVDQFHELLDQYPFSAYNEEAELKIAHAHYLNGNYAEATAALTDFQRRHPTSAHLPFVGYCLGMCYAKQMRTIDRDQSAAQNAANDFLTVSQQYPDSAYAELAREQLARCRENIGEHELYIANFYARRSNQKAAEIRLLTLAARYGDTDASADGLMRLARLYRSQHRRSDAVLAYEALTHLHPRGPSAETARRMLTQFSAPDAPPADTALDTLLALNNRQKSTGMFETVQVPGLEPARTAHRPAGAGPGIMPPLDPFGRGRGGRPY